MIIAFTGHRSDKLPDKQTGYKLPNPTYVRICQTTEYLLKQLQPTKCISGLALGFDQYAANVCIKLKIPFIAAVPFLGQESKWPAKSQQVYKAILAKADEVFIVSEGEYAPKKMHLRNEFMVNQADLVIACFDGTPGGTASCVNYTIKQKKPILQFNPNDPFDAVRLDEEILKIKELLAA